MIGYVYLTSLIKLIMKATLIKSVKLTAVVKLVKAVNLTGQVSQEYKF